MSSKHTYEILEKNEDNRLTLIEKGNLTTKFSLKDLETNITDMEKTLKELNAKYNHDKLVKENIEENHPWVKELDEMKLHTVYMYIEACEVVRQYEPKIKEFEVALEADKEEAEYIKANVLNDGEEA
jgi:ABC-type multidrug transport system ATPase subunit